MRKQNTHNVTGIIKTDKENIAFSGEDFKFVFMKTDLLGDEVVLKADESGYIWGTTHGEATIGIYSGTDINVKSTKILNTWNYIVSKNWPSLEHMWFDGIKIFIHVMLYMKCGMRSPLIYLHMKWIKIVEYLNLHQMNM